MKFYLAILSLAFLAACSEPTETQATTAATPTPEVGQESADWSLGYMAAVANPDATDAAQAMLAEGGHAVDAFIAAHAVLGLVEPESSGLGGGGFLVVYENATDAVRFMDGRETAPAGARPDMFMRDGEEMGFLDAWQSGNAVGVPGTIALYKMAHEQYGRLPWATLFEPAIRLASEGFEVTGKLAGFLPQFADFTRLNENPGSAEYFYPGGEPLQAGAIVQNPEYARTLQRVAEEGPSAFYSGEVAEAMAAAAQAGPDGGTLTVDDIVGYQAVEREAICGPWRALTLCSATPPSSGAMQIMVTNLYDQLLADGASQEEQIRAFVDAQRLAYADRDYYFGDPDHVAVPVEQLIDPRYLEHRANNPADPDATPQHGDPSAVLGTDTAAVWGKDSTREAAGTTHLSIVDNEGNAISATMTVESPFGSSRWAAGFLLNNEMTDFARDYDPEQTEPANMVRPGARPRSSMSPTVILNDQGELYMVTGSPGGNAIPAYTAKSILGIVDWGMTVEEVVAFPNIIARGETVRVEIGREPGPALAGQLNAAGYDVQESEGENSGLHVILVTEDGLVGAADPRREGTVVSGLSTQTAPAGWSPLLSPESLAGMLESGQEVRTLRVSGGHEAGHIPGSLPASYAQFRGPSSNPGALPSIEDLTATVRSLGLRETLPVVLVHDGTGPSDMGTATRIYWTLKSLGVRNLAILNGGFTAWQEAGLPVNTGTATVAPSQWSPRWNDEWQISTAEIEARLDDPALRLVDARPQSFFNGTQSSIARPGTIRGAANLSFDHWFDGNRMKTPMEIQQTLASNPLPDAAETASFCNTGHWASINWFALSELAGVPDTRMYAESMAEWSNADRSMDNQPNRLAHYWDMTAQWFTGLRER